LVYGYVILLYLNSLFGVVLGLKIQRMALTGGTSPVEYLEAFKITLFLTSEQKDVEEALRRGEKIPLKERRLPAKVAKIYNFEISAHSRVKHRECIFFTFSFGS
jgi:hypothetical protein